MSKRKLFFQTAAIFWKDIFWLSKVYGIAASKLIKNPFDFFTSHDQKGWNYARQDTLFLDPTLCQPIILWILSFSFRLILYVILKYQ